MRKERDMDKIFKASNGVEVRDAGHRLEWRSVHYPDWRAAGAPVEDGEPGFASDSLIGEALAEFFQHKRDEELGRWRWPENPDCVVYPVASEHAVVWDERRREPWYVHLDIAQAESVRTARDAFRAYLAAHHEPKPWHEAKPGEVWVLTDDLGTERPYSVDPFGKFRHTSGVVLVPELGITAGRRIYPEAGKE